MISRFILGLLAGCLFLGSAKGYNFSVSTLQGVALSGATSLQFGPDQRLYVAQVNGQIKALTVQRVAANNYTVTATEIINLVRDLPNYDDSGTRNFTLTTRQVTGLLVVGTAANPVIYVTSSDPRIGGGSGGENDLNLDTNSGVISRLTKSGSTWTKVDLVRGLPRSEENHASNGMQLEPITNTLYLAQGGNTNAGGPSINFAYASETALSAAILSVDLNAITALPLKTDPFGQKYYYDLPTVDDPNPDRGRNADGTNTNDPFGGNDGLNQARNVPGGPVQVYSPGFRNPYDVLLTRATGREGRLYSFDNAANQGWGGYPMNEGPSGTVTNQYVEGEAGTVNNLDNLHFIPERGYYGGHPNPIRANPAGAGWFHFDNTQPTGSQKIYSTSPTSDWPSVPVSLANPVEGDFRLPGTANGALLTNGASTNGLAEYISTHFNGEMQGNLIAASYDGKLLRIALSPDGTAVTNARETLASGFGNLPLDVTTPDPGNGAAFVGTIWVAHYSPAKISVLEPADFDSPGSSSCTGINSFDVDEDADGYSNADEIANNSSPCSGAIRPPDVDADFTSDLLDQDDDNDGIDDTEDPFPLDAQNGRSQSMPLRYELFNDAGYGFFGVGLTGVMMNRGEDYLQRMSPDNIIGGGTAGLFTVAEAGAGFALASSRSQKDAYQFAVNSDEFTTPFVVTGRLSGPFFANAPTASQRQGIYVGTGDQDNFVWVALHANGGAGGLEVVHEVSGSVVSQVMYPLSGLTTHSTIDLSFAIDPAAGTIHPGYQVAEGSTVVPLGSPINVTGAVLQSVMGTQPLAVGLFATTSNGATPTFSATWDYFDVTPVIATSRAKVIIDPSGSNMATASTYTSGTFRIENQSTGGQQIQSVTIDLSTAMLRDMVYDPTGTAGDVVAKNFQANSASTGVSLSSGVATHPHNGVNSQDGYDQVDVTFNSFPVGGTFTFSIDVDPNSVKGVAAPGQNDSASVSGLELIGSTATVYFNDGTVHRTRLTRVESSVDGAYGWLRSDKPPKPGISFLNKTSPLQSGQAQETVRVSGPAGLTATLLIVESALYVGGVPGGGYDLDPYESNTAIRITETSGVIPAAGYRDFVITPTKANPDAGFNVITAVLSNASAVKGSASDALTLWYDPSFSGGDTQPPTTPESLTAPNVTSRSVTLSWSAATDNIGVRAYDILRNGALVSSTLGLSFTDVGLEADTSYQYTVVARDEAGNSSPAAALSVPTPANGTVVLRMNTGGPAYVDTAGMTWTADSGYNTGTISSATNPIDRAIDDTLFQTARIDSATTAPDLAYAFSLPNGDYEVQLFFAELNTANSAVGKRVFDIVIESQLAFDNFDIFALAGAPYTAVAVAATTSVTDGQLNLAFVRGIGNPKVNAIKVIRLPAEETVAPTTPTNFRATNITPDSVTLAWNASTDNVGVTGYVVTRGGNPLVTTPDVSLTDVGLAPMTAYTYTVRATDAAGNLSGAASVTVTTLDPAADSQPPTSPGALTFSAITSSSITVNWTAATDDVAVTGYRISRDGSVLATVTGLNFIDTGLVAGTSYAYAVVAVDAAGNASPASAGTSQTTTGGGTGTTVRVNAGGPSVVDSLGQTWAADSGYNTGRSTTNTRTVTGTTAPALFKTERYQEANNPPLVYTLAVANGDYRVRLHFAETYTATSGAGKRRFDIDLQSVRAFSNVDIFVLAGGADKALVLEKAVTVTQGQITVGFGRLVENPKINAIEILPLSPSSDTQAPTPPGSPTFSNVTASSVTLTWTAATDNVGITGYRISRNGTEVTTVPSLTYSDTGLNPGTSYTYEVVALDAAGNASTGSSATVATGAGPVPATTVRINAGGPAYIDPTGVTWSADQGYNTGKATTNTATVTGTTAPQLFKTERYDDPTNPALTYTIPVLNGSYFLRLHMAETYTPSKGAGLRVFSIDVQGVRTFQDVDIFVQAGGGNKALVLQSPVTVTNGQITVTFINQVQNPKVNAIEVVPQPEDIPAPGSPTNLAASDLTPTNVTLTWTAPSGTASVTGYRITRDGTVLNTVTGTTFNDSGLTPATTYEYAVASLDAGGRASIPAPLSVTTPVAPDTQAPTAPGALVFDTVTDSSVTLSWAASTDNVGVTGYEISRNGTLLTTIPELTFTDTLLTASTSYDYSVVAIDAAGNPSSASVGTAATTASPDTQAPTAPGPLVFSAITADTVTVSWTAATDNVGVTDYEISRDGVVLTTVTELTFKDTALTASTGYDYAIVALDAAGNRSAASEGTATTTAAVDTQAPTAPGSLLFSAVTANGVTIDWTAATDNVGVTEYEISRDGQVLTTVTGLTFTDSGLLPSTSYAYAVVARDAAGNTSPASSGTIATIAGPTDTEPPSAPGSLGFSAITAQSVTVSWTAATDNVGVTAYEISRDGVWLADVTDLSFTDTGLTASTSYTYSVVAADAAGNGSPVVSAAVQTAAPTPPTVIRINAGGGTVVDTQGRTWAADSGYNTGRATSNTRTVTGTTAPALFKTERYEDSTNPPLVYTFAVPNREYLVRLHLAETYLTAQKVGGRLFNIDIQSVRAFTNVDIFVLAGGTDKALVLEKNATVTNGQIRISFGRNVQNPKINAIEILSVP